MKVSKEFALLAVGWWCAWVVVCALMQAWAFGALAGACGGWWLEFYRIKRDGRVS